MAVPGSLAGGKAVEVAQDGSTPASRAIQAFVRPGLVRPRDVHVLSVAPDRHEAIALAGPAVDDLRPHGLDPPCHPV